MGNCRRVVEFVTFGFYALVIRVCEIMLRKFLRDFGVA